MINIDKIKELIETEGAELAQEWRLAEENVKRVRANLDDAYSGLLSIAKLMDEAGEPITEYKQAHRCTDIDEVTTFYHLCNVTVSDMYPPNEEGQCPVDTAEVNFQRAENKIINKIATALGRQEQQFSKVARAKLVDLFFYTLKAV